MRNDGEDRTHHCRGQGGGSGGNEEENNKDNW